MNYILLSPAPGEYENTMIIFLFYFLYLLFWIIFIYISIINLLTKKEKLFTYFKFVSLTLFLMHFIYVVIYIENDIAIYYERGHLFHGLFIFIPIQTIFMTTVYLYKLKQKLV